MARRNNKNKSEQSTNPTQEVEMTDTVVEPEVQADTTTDEAPVEEHDTSEFEAAVEAAVALRDEHTGDIPVADVQPVLLAYKDLTGGVKTKNRAKEYLTEAMRTAMIPPVEDIVLARAYMLLSNSLTTPAAKAPRASREPVDPTEGYVQANVALRLAQDLVKENVPEGVSEDWRDKANEVYTSSQDDASALYSFLTTEQEEGAEAPEVSTVVEAAVKLALGKSARVARRGASGGSRATYTGERRDVAKHIAEAFENEAPGTFLKVAEIRKFHSSEYGADLPSAGAISARLKSAKFEVEGITPETGDDGRLGARKA